MSGPLRQLQAAGGIRKLTITIAAPQASWSLKSALTALGVDASRPVDVTITVANIITGPMAFEAMPSGSKVRLVNNGKIYGRYNAGDAMSVATPLVIVNNGVIAGGGGWGGAGASVTHRGMPAGGTTAAQCTSMTLRGGSGGDGAGMSGTTYLPATSGGSGAAGATDAGSRPGSGGNGGGMGQSGSSGGGGYNGSSHALCGASTGSYVNGNPGVGPGRYVSGNSFVTWEVKGSLLGGVA